MIASTEFSEIDALGRVRRSRHTIAGLPPLVDATGNAKPHEFEYRYNIGGALTGVKYPSGRWVTYDVTGANRVLAVRNGETGTNYYLANATYGPHGALTSAALVQGLVTETREYNGRLQPSRVALAKSGQAMLGLKWIYSASYDPVTLLESGSDNSGNIRYERLEYPLTSGTRSILRTYGYDGASRIASFNEDTGKSQAFAYDGFGNVWRNGFASGVPDLTPDGPSWYLQSGGTVTVNNQFNGVQYDAAGNQAQLSLTVAGTPLVWDGENRLVRVGQATSPIATYEYDAEGRRVKRSTGGVTTYYLYDGAGQLMAEYGGGTSTAGTRYLLTDHLGSTRLIVDGGGGCQSRMDYAPFGAEIDRAGEPCYASSTEVAQKFSSKERDAETGLDYFGARYFSGAQGRFTSPDAPFADQKVNDPQSWNLYAYARNNPLKFVDDTGRGATLAAVRAARQALQQRLFAAARREGVRVAWAQERELVMRTGIGSRRWTEAQMKQLIDTGKVTGFVGHHINSVAHNSLDMARNPNNVKFVEGQAENLAEHGGNFRNETSGSLIDRLAQMGGPALLTFFTVFDEKLNQFTSSSECPMCSGPDSWLSAINPFNNIVEVPALLEALAAADRMEQLQKKLREAEEQRQKCGQHGEACPGSK